MTISKPIGQLNGLNKLLEAIYENPVTLDDLLTRVGLASDVITIIKNEHLSELISLITESLIDLDTATGRQKGQHEFIIRYYGLLTGNEEDDYEIHHDYGVSGQRIKQLRERRIRDYQDKEWQRYFEENLYKITLKYL